MSKHLVWFRADLRTHDHPALWEAARPRQGVVGLFVICPAFWRGHDVAPVKIDFQLRTLAELSRTLERLNIPLLIRTVAEPGAVPEAVLAVARAQGCGDVHFCREYEVNERRRDEAFSTLARGAGVGVRGYHDQAIMPPGEVLTQQGGTFTVFTPFKKAFYREVLSRGGVSVLPEPATQPALPCRPDDVPERVEGFESTVDPSLWPAGEAHALARLSGFIERKLRAYKDRRDFPAADATSTLSPYLASGVLSPRTTMRAAFEANGDRFESKNDGATHWLSELVWREFYKHILDRFPRVCMHRAFKPATDRIRWDDDPARFEAWAAGRTGVPIVDAAMRQLAGTGWMHNRLRMIAAMYFTKDLFLDWRLGERHFMRHLVDGDLSQNNGGWQWSASTGTDAAPYFRIFNPIAQSERFDPEGVFIRRWVPELAGVEGDAVHEPGRLPGLLRSRLDYPEPIADHAAARERVMAAFRAIGAA